MNEFTTKETGREQAKPTRIDGVGESGFEAPIDGHEQVPALPLDAAGAVAISTEVMVEEKKPRRKTSATRAQHEAVEGADNPLLQS